MLKTWKKRCSIYAKLMRLDRPIGTLLLLWPTLWALVLGANGLPHWHILLIFMVGTLLMRSAGCVINDYADRHIDGHVQRTKERPFAQGNVKPKEALYLAASLALMAFSLTFYLPIGALFWSIPAVLIAAIYPYTKRFFPLPQAVLGLAFSFGMPMAFVALAQPLDARLWLLFAANLCWVIAYDTIYALVDRPDDIKLGIRTSAITFGRHVMPAILMFHGLFLGLMLVLGVLTSLRWPYWLSLFLVATLIAKQIQDIKSNDPQLCFQAFLHNNRIGCVVFLGLSGHYLMT
ncbi:MAG: 4-hydroxybenzoate octaprenyltransferase [Neisseriaceae bacterium]|nr:4-hydroxybenzoate octaprenyltransferase [Neisseriaceae bacterium]